MIHITTNMKYPIGSVIPLGDLKGTRKAIVVTALLLALIPGLAFIFYFLLTDLEGPNPFLVATGLILSLISLIVGLTLYLIADNKLKRKTIYIGLLILFQVSVLPTIWLINEMKLRVFLVKHDQDLEFIANNVLDKKWTWGMLPNTPLNRNSPLDSQEKSTRIRLSYS